MSDDYKSEKSIYVAHRKTLHDALRCSEEQKINELQQAVDSKRYVNVTSPNYTQYVAERVILNKKIDACNTNIRTEERNLKKIRDASIAEKDADIAAARSALKSKSCPAMLKFNETTHTNSISILSGKADASDLIKRETKEMVKTF